jgi:DNA-binding transcriptional LysR family regulator
MQAIPLLNDMDAIRSMQTFVRAVELGTLSAVAREQAMTQPTTSKHIAGLEKALGVRLLERSTTRLVTTDEGRRFYERAKRVLEEYDEAVADARGLTQTPAGLLRVNAPLALGELRLSALVLEFLARYPGIEIELILNDRFVDLSEEGVDLALRLGGPLPLSVVARRIAVSSRCLVCAPAYLLGRPKIRRRRIWPPTRPSVLRGPTASVASH